MNICICGKFFKNGHSLAAHYKYCTVYREQKGLGDPPQPFTYKDGSSASGWNKGLTKYTSPSIAKGVETLKLLRKNGNVTKRKHRTIILGGYREFFSPNHPNARKDKYVFEHTLVAEQKIGRFLNKGEVVHHIDGNRKNNVPENLIVFKTSGDHTRYHRGKNTSLEEVETGVYICNIDYNKCTICGKFIRRCKTGLCNDCYVKSGKQLALKNIPNYVDLLLMIENGESCLTLAKMYGTSYQTIRSRIRKKI